MRSAVLSSTHVAGRQRQRSLYVAVSAWFRNNISSCLLLPSTPFPLLPFAVLTPPAPLCVIFADLARTQGLNVQAVLAVALSNKAICTTDGAAVTAVMPLTAGRRQRVKFVNYVNFNWPSLLLPPTLPLSMPFTTYVTCQKCSLLQGDPSTSSPFPSTLPACLPLKVLRLWLRVVFHKLLAASVDSPMWHVAPAPSPSLLCVIVCPTHTCSLPLSHSLSLSLCLSVMRRNVVTCAQQIASAGFEFCGYISVAPSASIFTLGWEEVCHQKSERE